jgi:hypothetical protein
MTYGILFDKVESGELPPGLKGKTPKAKQPSRPQPSFAPDPYDRKAAKQGKNGCRERMLLALIPVPDSVEARMKSPVLARRNPCLRITRSRAG